MNKYIKIFATTAIGAFMFQSCDNFLEVDPYGHTYEENAITNETNAQAAATGIYDALQHYYYYGRDFVVNGDAMTDNIALSPTNSNRFVSQAYWNWTKSTADVAYFWNKAYEAINRANNLINKEGIEGDEIVINRLKGEAYALRALCHFDLVRTYAQNYNFTADQSHLGIPYITKHDAAGKPTRNTVAEVYTNIIADLTKAEELVKTARLKEPYTISPNAIKAILAKVYLYMGDYDESRTYAEGLMSAYSLVSTDAYLDSWAKENTPEMIFGITQTLVDNQSSNALGYIYIEAGYGDLLVNPSLMALYADDDVRREWFVKGGKSSTASNTYAKNKFPGRDTGTPGLDTYNVIRLSEIYLIAAEACLKGTAKDEAKAREYLDIIRKRAQPSAAATTATGQDLMDAILLEKRKEFAFEGNYYHDQKRLQLTIIGAVTGGTSQVTTTYPSDKFAWPIPERELEANPNIAKEQNPGY